MNKFIALVVVSCCLLGCAGNFARLNGDDKYDIPQADMRVSVTSTVAQPSGYDPTEVITDAPVISNPLVPSATVTQVQENREADFYFIKDDKDSTQPEPVLETMVLAGAGVTLLGVGAAVAAVFAGPVLFFAAAALFGIGCWLSAIGWKRIKKEPKKYKGEKFAMASYIVVGIIGVAASFYLLYLLFTI